LLSAPMLMNLRVELVMILKFWTAIALPFFTP